MEGGIIRSLQAVPGREVLVVVAIVFCWHRRDTALLPFGHLLLLRLVDNGLAWLSLAAIIDDFVYQDILVRYTFGFSAEAVLHNVVLGHVQRLKLVVFHDVQRSRFEKLDAGDARLYGNVRSICYPLLLEAGPVNSEQLLLELGQRLRLRHRFLLTVRVDRHHGSATAHPRLPIH